MTPPLLRMVVTGGRSFARTRPQQQLVHAALSAAAAQAVRTGAWQPGTTILLSHGACTGTDRAADAAARTMGWPRDAWPVDWEHERRTRPDTWRHAGPERNRAMLTAVPRPWALLRFPGGHGTAHCARTAHQLGIPVITIPPTPTTPHLAPLAITITTRDFPATLAFYAVGLGLPISHGPTTTPAGIPEATIDTGAARLRIIGAPPPAPTGPQLEFACRTPNAMQHTLAGRGYQPAHATTYTDPTGTPVAITTHP